MHEPLLSVDQVAAFVELARQGSLRRAADRMNITEQGLRNRLVALERRLKVELYRKSRGIRTVTPLTAEGLRFLPAATAFLERAQELGEVFSAHEAPREVHVAASQYVVLYVLIDATRRFRAAFPNIHIQLSTRTEREIEGALREDPGVAFGVAAPYEPSRDLVYTHLFSMGWSLITPPRHPLLRKKTIGLSDLADQPLILFERGSTGRQHVMDAFYGQGISPRTQMETTSTEIIVRMVEAGLGVSIVPLLASGSVTRGRRVQVRALADEIQPIHTGILMRSGEKLTEPARAFAEFIQSEWAEVVKARPGELKAH